MTTQAITLNANALTLPELVSQEMQKAKQIVVSIRSLDNIDQQMAVKKTGDTIMCPW